MGASLTAAAVTALVLASVAALARPHVASAAHAILAAGATLLAVCIVSVEALSLLRVLSRGSVAAIGWALTVLVVAAALARGSLACFLQECRRGDAAVPRDSRLTACCAVILGVIGSATMLTGVSTAPNNLDSLAYHVPRIMQWFQNGQVEHFPTSYPAQVYLAPGAEQATAVLLAMWRTDHSLFLVRWFAWIMTGVAVHRTSVNLGVSSPRHRMIGVVVALAAPSVVGEAATTQNDLVATALIASAITFLTERVTPRARDAGLLLVPVFLGLACATKPPVAVLALPCIIWYTLRWLRTLPRPHRRRSALLSATAASAVVLAVNLGWMARNVHAFGSLTGPDLGLTVSASHVQAAASSAVRNLAHGFAVPFPATFDARIVSILGWLSEALSGAAPDDPRFTYGDFDADSQLNEDRAANLGQALLLLVSGLVLVAHRPLRQRLVPLALCLGAGYLLLCALVRYQTWGGRLLLPLVVETGVVTALALHAARARTVLAAGVLALVTVQAAPWVLAQKWRPLVTGHSTVLRDDFADLTASLSPAEADAVDSVIRAVRAADPATIQLTGPGAHDHEYVWWRYLANSADAPTSAMLRPRRNPRLTSSSRPPARP